MNWNDKTKKNNRSEYNSWMAMRQRCHYPKHKNYAIYGGRGIIVCERWFNSFDAFLEDMGPKPSPKHTLDRFPDKNGNYEPGNCRWATQKQQCNNKNCNHLIECDGEVKTVTEWARMFNTDQATIIRRHEKGLHLNQQRIYDSGPPPQVGVKNAKAKLSEADVRQIREMAATVNTDYILQFYPVTRSTINKIIRREAWGHI